MPNTVIAIQNLMYSKGGRLAPSTFKIFWQDSKNFLIESTATLSFFLKKKEQARPSQGVFRFYMKS